MVRTAFGDELERVAASGVEAGHSFPIVWVVHPGEDVDTAERTPWPAEDVRVLHDAKAR